MKKRFLRPYLLLSAALVLIAPSLPAITYDVGPGLAVTNLGAVPWGALAAGDTVNIHYQPGGYHEVILLSNSGTPGAPITINGVPDPTTGAWPVIDGQNALSATNIPWQNNSLNTEGVIVVAPGASQPYPYFPEWLVIQNLHVQNASPSNQVAQTAGGTNAFASTAAAIYVEFAQHLVVSNCELNASCNGFFCGAENGDPNETSADMLIESCWIHDNGSPGNYEAHNVYTQSKGITIQNNLIGPLQANADGVEIKDLSSGTILRDNLVILGTGGAAFWLVQPDGGVGVIDLDPAYHTNFVYGNIFLNLPNSGALVMFIYDFDEVGSQPRNGTLYFYNNTVVNDANQSVRYYTHLFEMPTHADVTALNIHDVLDCRNNIFAALPATTGAAPSQVYLLESDDSTVNLGTNWASPGLLPLALPYGDTNFYGAITGTNGFIFGDSHGLNNPGFVNLAGTNFNLLSSSPCIDAGGRQAPGVLASPNNVIYEYTYPTGAQLRPQNGMGLDLGALEGVSTNFTGPLYGVTVNNGFGGGSYPVNATVTIEASNAPPGETFAGWTGYAVDNPASVGATFTMPAANVALSATYSNVPYFTLTVSNGTGGGSYLPGATAWIQANPPPSGQEFAAWSGLAVANPGAANTWLIMPNNDVTVTATYTNAPVTSLYGLTVVNGSGSGSYTPGTVVSITANAPATNETFSGWTGYTVANASALSTTLVMPAGDVTVTAAYQYSGVLPSMLPPPVASHPRLWLTTNDLAKYRSWAVATNPIYAQGFVPLLQKCVSDYQTQFFPGGVPNANYPDFGDTQGYTGLLTEQYAFILAFDSLIDPNPTNRCLYAQYARNLLIYARTQAAQGTLANAPFRDPLFPVYNRANGSGENWPLAVDWIYNAVDTNGQPVLSAADKLTIRNAFMVWAGQCLTASTTGGDSPVPVGVLDNQQLLPGGSAYRMAANNYYAGHARLMTLMSLAFDPADDPPVNTNLPVSVLGNSLRSYLDDAVGSWLYQQYAMFGEVSNVVADCGLATNASVGLTSGGLPAEGMLYGHSTGFVLGGLLGLQTAGYNDPSIIGPQARLLSSPVWGRFSQGMLSSIVPAAQVNPAAAYLGPIFEMDSYGDLLRLWMTPDFMEPVALQALLEQYNGSTNHNAAARWFMTQGVEGGSAALLSRVSDPWSYGVTESVLYFMLLDPNLAPAPDPRPAFPLAFQDAPLGRIVDRTAWKSNAAQFDFLASWISINHQQGAGGQFELYRNGEWLTKELCNYDDNLNGQSSMWLNTLALQNWCPAGDPNLDFGEQLFLNGSEFMLGEAAGDPVTLTSSSPGYTYATADLTPLFNMPNIWNPQVTLQDIKLATRNLIWVKPDHIIIYDRATSTHAGLFKRFNVNFVAPPVIAGHCVTETTPGGQQLFVETLLPTNATCSYVPLGDSLTTVADLEPSIGRAVIEDTNDPADARFLHVLQGADGGAAPDAPEYVASTAGNAFEGATVRGVVALFPVTPLAGNFTSLAYSVPAGITNHFIGGLAPAAFYSAAQTTAGGTTLVTVSPGGGLQADNAGLLSFDNAGRTLSGAPQFISESRVPGGINLTASGMVNVTYTVLASTNLAVPGWSAIGTAQADTNGVIQFTEPSASAGAEQFYRLVH
jgi:hypothetical protein